MSIRKTASGGQVTGFERYPDDTMAQVHEPGGTNLKEIAQPFLREGSRRGWNEDDEAGLAAENDLPDAQA